MAIQLDPLLQPAINTKAFPNKADNIDKKQTNTKENIMRVLKLFGISLLVTTCLVLVFSFTGPTGTVSDAYYDFQVANHANVMNGLDAAMQRACAEGENCIRINVN